MPFGHLEALARLNKNKQAKPEIRSDQICVLRQSGASNPSVNSPTQGRIQPGCTGCTCTPLVSEYMSIYSVLNARSTLNV